MRRKVLPDWRRFQRIRDLDLPFMYDNIDVIRMVAEGIRWQKGYSCSYTLYDVYECTCLLCGKTFTRKSVVIQRALEWNTHTDCGCTSIRRFAGMLKKAERCANAARARKTHRESAFATKVLSVRPKRPPTTIVKENEGE